jgi:hypothetical protein
MKHVLLAVTMMTLFGAGSVQAGGPPPVIPGNPSDVFVHAENNVESLAGCLVSTGGFGPLASCFCAASGNTFAFCNSDTIAFDGGFTELAAGRSIALAGTSLAAPVKTGGSFDDILIKVTGSCTLQGENSKLEIDFGNSVDDIYGETARYAAVYAFPMVNGVAAGEPIRLCARGQDIVLGEFSVGGDFETEFDLAQEDTGGAYAFQWVAPNVKKESVCAAGPNKCWKKPLTQTHNVEVRFVVVAGVDAALVNKFGPDYTALGVLAKANLKDRAGHFEAKNLAIYDGNNPQ